MDDQPDPSAANALQEGLGGQFGEMRTMMQYLFQMAPERPEEFAPGLDPELQAMADALQDFKDKTVKEMEKKAGPNPRKKKES